MIAQLIQGGLLALPAVIVPSSLKVFLISRTLQGGWRSIWPALFTPLITDAPIALLVLLILRQTPFWFFHLLQISGGLFVLYLAWRLLPFLRTRGVDYQAVAQMRMRRTLLQAVGINFLNPVPYIFVSGVLVPRTLSALALARAPGQALGFLLGFYGILIGGMGLLVLAFDRAGRLDPRVNYGLLIVSILGLVVLGLQQIGAGVLALWG